ncbi:hypothetical protein [Pseudoflavonifractor sp. MSJ-37]|uniref:hypothetical protein n=1 Tax=Pseudoflavonifractor sp. MSJ-37 TaxID=2841531 RepID=UPI001C11EBCB|nr:hypothetical protein [Pseudoflavonifractor sp. MSJ-37]MBU5436229.1 hypothetical protein [Pseudoflavonifractor sp. MSJ-37]
MRELVLVLISLLPFAGSYMLERQMTTTGVMPPFLSLATLFLLAWGFAAWAAVRLGMTGRRVLLCLHLVPTLDLVLLAVQELILRRYWMSWLGVWSQLYYLPLVNMAARLTRWSGRLFMTYVTAFLMLLAAAWLGTRLGTRHRE